MPLRVTTDRSVISPLLAWAFLVLAPAAPARAEDVPLVILHTTDLHGALTPYDYMADRPSARGLVRIASLVDSARAGDVRVLLLDAGDTIEGAVETVRQLADSTSSDPMMAAMSRMGYDAMAVGNHEFDFGRAALERARKEARFPWLAANVVNAADRRPAFEASLVKELGGVRVGVVGLCTPAVPSMTDPANVTGLRFESPVEAARREVRTLRAEKHCDVVVLLAHTGLERDTTAVGTALRAGATPPTPEPDENWGLRLAVLVPEADVVILGHTHRVIASAPESGPVMAQAGVNGEQLGRIELTLSRSGAGDPWRITRRRASAIPVTATTPDQPALAALAEPTHRRTQQALASTIGRSTRAIAAPRGRLEDSPLWELVHRAQLEASGADVSLAPLFDPDASIPAGAITLRHVLRLYPYANTLGVVKLTGGQLRQVLERSARGFARYAFKPGASLFVPGAPGYDFESAKGVTYEVDLTRPEGERIVALERHGRAVRDDDTLTVAVNSYRMNVGGGFPAIATAPRVSRSGRRVWELIIDYLRRHDPPTVEYAPGWRLLPDFVATPERPLIERLVAYGALPEDEARRLGAGSVARRGDLAYWIARAFDWREPGRSGAFADAPDSLAPWLDGLLKRKVLGESGTMDRLRTFDPVLLSTALDWCERAARSAGYALRPTPDTEFRRGLLHRTAGAGGRPGAHRDTLTRATVLGMVANLRFPEIRVLETTDFHGAILGGSRDRRTGRALGGSAVLAAWIARLRDENPAGTVLLDGGDCFQGTMISNLQFGRPVVEQMNALGYAAGAIGNHEFDWSADTLARRVRDMRHAALGANMIERKSGHRPRWARSDTVVARRGVRIGILGMCYRNTPSVTLARHVAHLRFEDDSVTAARLVPALAKRSDLVLGVGHTPAETDSLRAARSGDLVRLARGVPGVAAWFGGHSHNLVCDRVGGVPAIIAGSHGEAVGVCDLVVDPLADKALDARIELIRTWADEVTPDSAMAARVERWNAAVAPIAAKEIGRNARGLRRDRGGESGIGDLVTDAMRAASGADIALQNPGGLRADLAEGPVTRGAIYEVMPFDNTVVMLELSGREVRQALEQALRSSRVTQVSGIRYTFDPGRPAMDRVVSLADASGAPLDSVRVYRVAVNDFMATGGDNYDVLKAAPKRTMTGLLVRDALEKLVAERSAKGPMDAAPDGRIQRIGGRPAGGAE